MIERVDFRKLKRLLHLTRDVAAVAPIQTLSLKNRHFVVYRAKLPEDSLHLALRLRTNNRNSAYFSLLNGVRSFKHRQEIYVETPVSLRPPIFLCFMDGLTFTFYQ